MTLQGGRVSYSNRGVLRVTGRTPELPFAVPSHILGVMIWDQGNHKLSKKVAIIQSRFNWVWDC